jgi:proline dehydrogenase
METLIQLDNTDKAFSSRSNKQLKRSLWLFTLMKNATLVNFFSKLTLLSMKINLPVKSLIKNTIFNQFCGGENIEESKKVVVQLKRSNVKSILDYSVEGKETEEDFENTKNEILNIITLAKNNDAIPYTCIKLTGIIPHSLLEKLNVNNILSEEEIVKYLKCRDRLNEICKSAYVNKVPVYIDAEESWIQFAIDRLAEEMMSLYNKESAIVLTTLQIYRWDRLDQLRKLIEQARRDKIFIGVKLVRGAYLEKENKRALELGYRSPVYANKLNTDIDFDEAVSICLKNIDIVTLCAGTHNEKSTLYLIDIMKRLNIPQGHPNVYFSQLYGMSDHITYNLAAAGYNVTKYLPYGPVRSVIPYLIRRAQENTAIAGQMGRELKLIVEERERRSRLRLLK